MTYISIRPAATKARREFVPLAGHAYHSKTVPELLYIIRDAGEAARNMRGLDAAAECKYLDQVNDACTVLAYRRRLGQEFGGR